MPNHKALLDKWSNDNLVLKKNLADKHGQALSWVKENSKNVALGSLGALVMLASGPKTIPIQHQTFAQVGQAIDKRAFLISDLLSAVPKEVVPPTKEQETKIEGILSRNFNLDVHASLENKRLNTAYGIIGAEQHLMRYPGDSMATHFESQEETNKYFSSGMAPGRGAWGYFAQSQQTMTKEDAEKEKYYIAVQTFLSEDFNSRFAEYRDFYKYRKMLVINPQNGHAIIADIADAGPAEWTGKHLGGSPEVMKYLERVDGAQRGPVIYMFIDDPENKVSLGPIEIVK